MARITLFLLVLFVVGCGQQENTVTDQKDKLIISENEMYYISESEGSISTGEVVDKVVTSTTRTDEFDPTGKSKCAFISCCGDIGSYEAGINPFQDLTHTLKVTSIKYPCIYLAKKYRLKIKFRNGCNPEQELRSGQWCIPGGKCLNEHILDLPLNYNLLQTDLTPIPYFDTSCDCYEFSYQIQWTTDENTSCYTNSGWNGCSGWSPWLTVPGHPFGTPGAVSCF